MTSAIISFLKSQRGLSLIEMLASVVLLTILGGVLLGILRTTLDSYQRTAGIQEFYLQAAKVIQAIGEEIRQGHKPTFDSGTRVAFDKVRYRWRLARDTFELIRERKISGRWYPQPRRALAWLSARGKKGQPHLTGTSHKGRGLRIRVSYGQLDLESEIFVRVIK